MARNFMEMLEAHWAEGKFVCVGLDSKYEELPENVRQVDFNCKIVDATKDITACYKPNLAFYGRENGRQNLFHTINYIKQVAPHVPVIIDVKQGDIGNTNLGYVEDAFEYYGADACTVHNYMGKEAMRPFLDRKDKGIIVLCKTSNSGSGEFQNLSVNVSQMMLDELAGKPVDTFDHTDRLVRETVPLYRWVARRVASPHGWNYNGNCGVVAGATYPSELEEIRDAVDDLLILCPGAGKQGGNVKATVRATCDSRGKGFLVNSSSGIIFASKGPDYADAAHNETRKLQDEITKELLALA